MDEFIKIVIEESGLTKEQFLGPCRDRRHVMARELAARHLAYEHGLIDKQIGLAINRSRGTVFNLLKNYDADAEYDEAFKELIRRVEKRYAKKA